MYEVTLTDLNCQTVSNLEPGSDECLLEVRVDGAHRDPYPLHREFEEGDSWTIGRSYGFDTKIEFTLTEGGPLFDTDLGSSTIQEPAPASTSATFDQGGAEYTLNLSTDEFTSGGVDPVTHAVNDFNNSNTGVVQSGSNQGNGTVWPELTKADLVSRLTAVVVGPGANPNVLDQGGTPFCGFVALAYGLALRQPRRFVELTRALFETGEMLTTGDHIELSEAFKDDSVPSGTDTLEWLLTGSLREAVNYVFDVENDAFLDGNRALIHAAIPWVISGLIESVLDYSNAEWYMDDRFNTLIQASNALPFTPPIPVEILTTDTEDLVEMAGEAHRNDGLGILLIEMELISGQTASAPNAPSPITSPAQGRARFPNHYVTCLTDNPISGTDFDFEVQSWGGRAHIDMPQSDCEDYIWGVVRGYP